MGTIYNPERDTFFAFGDRIVGKDIKEAQLLHQIFLQASDKRQQAVGFDVPMTLPGTPQHATVMARSW